MQDPFAQAPLPENNIPEQNIEIYPSIRRRIMSVFIDFVTLLLAIMALFSLLENYGETPEFVKIIVIVLLFFYEPILTATSCTVGQKIMGIRVRNFDNQDKKISFINACIRFVIKSLLGWLSYIAVHANSE